MKNSLKLLLITFSTSLIVACGGGSSSSGGEQSSLPTPDPVPAEPPAPTTMPGQFATQCMDNIQVRRNMTALVQNVCGFSINVRQTNSRFGVPTPVTEIAPGQITAVRLGDDSLSVGFGACRSPSIPEPASPGFFSCTNVPANGERSKNLNSREARELLAG